MSRTIGIGRHHHAVPAAQRTKRPQGWSTHPRAARALGVMFLMVAATAACTAQPAEQSEAESAPTTAVVLPLLEEQPRDVPLAPGRYVLSPFDSPSTAPMAPVLQVPQGYFSIEGAGVIADEADDSDRYLWLWDIGSVYTHPCDVGGYPEPVGPSVADLAGALAAQPMRDGTDPVAVTIRGYDGLYVELSTPDEIDFTTCRQGYFSSWPGRFDTAEGQADLLWIVDVEGQRITFDLSYPPGTTPEQVNELREIVTTATFIPREGM